MDAVPEMSCGQKLSFQATNLENRKRASNIDGQCRSACVKQCVIVKHAVPVPGDMFEKSAYLKENARAPLQVMMSKNADWN